VADQSETASLPWSDVYAVDDPEFSPGPHRTRAVLHNGYLDVPVTFRSACAAVLEMFAVPQRSLRIAHTAQRTQPRRRVLPKRMPAAASRAAWIESQGERQ
jgi:hypothetical protein